jgi:hypothetical protein
MQETVEKDDNPSFEDRGCDLQKGDSAHPNQ